MLKLSSKTFLKNILKVLDCSPRRCSRYLFKKTSLCQQYFDLLVDVVFQVELITTISPEKTIYNF